MATSDPEFERFIFVDWSASKDSGKGKNSIWIGSCTRENVSNSVFHHALACYEKGENKKNRWNEMLKANNNGSNFLENPWVANFPTRKAAFNFLKDILIDSKEKTLIGFDFGFGYPHKAYGVNT